MSEQPSTINRIKSLEDQVTELKKKVESQSTFLDRIKTYAGAIALICFIGFGVSLREIPKIAQKYARETAEEVAKAEAEKVVKILLPDDIKAKLDKELSNAKQAANAAQQSADAADNLAMKMSKLDLATLSTHDTQIKTLLGRTSENTYSRFHKVKVAQNLTESEPFEIPRQFCGHVFVQGPGGTNQAVFLVGGDGAGNVGRGNKVGGGFTQLIGQNEMPGLELVQVTKPERPPGLVKVSGLPKFDPNQTIPQLLITVSGSSVPN